MPQWIGTARRGASSAAARAAPVGVEVALPERGPPAPHRQQRDVQRAEVGHRVVDVGVAGEVDAPLGTDHEAQRVGVRTAAERAAAAVVVRADGDDRHAGHVHAVADGRPRRPARSRPAQHGPAPARHEHAHVARQAAQRAEVEVVEVEVGDQHGVERPASPRGRAAAPCRRRCASRPRSRGSVSSRAPPTAISAVAWPTQVRRSGVVPPILGCPAVPRIAIDLQPLRASRDLRLLLTGEFLTGLGTQAALVALPFQLYTQTGSAFLTGLLGAVELVPLIAAGLYGGAIADRMDRRRLLLLVQIGLVLTALGARRGRARGRAAGLAALRARRRAGGLRGGRGRDAHVDRAEPRRARAPARRAGARLRPVPRCAAIVGPAAGGLLIAAAGVEGAYIADAASCLCMTAAAARMGPQLPHGEHADRHRHPAVDRRGAAVRARQPGAQGVVRDRSGRDDVRDAARAVPGALRLGLRHGRGRHGRCSTRRCRRAPSWRR